MVVGTSGISPNDVGKVVKRPDPSASVLSTDRLSKTCELFIPPAESHQGREADIALS